MENNKRSLPVQPGAVLNQLCHPCSAVRASPTLTQSQPGSYISGLYVGKLKDISSVSTCILSTKAIEEVTQVQQPAGVWFECHLLKGDTRCVGEHLLHTCAMTRGLIVSVCVCVFRTCISTVHLLGCTQVALIRKHRAGTSDPGGGGEPGGDEENAAEGGILDPDPEDEEDKEDKEDKEDGTAKLSSRSSVEGRSPLEEG